MTRSNGTKYESEFRDILRKNGHVAVLGSIVDVDVVDVCCGILYEVKSSMRDTSRPHISFDSPRLVEQYKKMRDYSKKVRCRYAVRYRGRKWYYYDVLPDQIIPTSLEYIPDANVLITSKGRSIKGILQPINDMDFLFPLELPLDRK